MMNRSQKPHHHRKTIYILSFFVALSLLAAPRPTAAQTPPVLAFYYAWFDESTWVSGQPADTPSPTYRSADPATIERHVSQAKSAGLTGFVQSWYGPQVENNQTETNFRILLDTAARYQFQAAVDVEVMGPFFPNREAVQAGLASLMGSHIHHPAYLRYQGKPVIFFWRQQRFSVAEWAQIRQAVDPNHDTYWIAEGVDLSYQDVFDGHHLYSIAWAGSPAGELNKWPPRIQSIEERLGVDKLWVATAMPGYNDLNLPRANAFVRGREEGAYYRQTWAAAQATNPDMIIITSFNEWLEGTQIEPSVSYGNFYLDLTRELVAGLGSTPPPTEPTPVPPPAVEPTISPTEPQDATSPAPVAPETAPPEAPPEEYLVQSGDTIYGIAERFDLVPQAIIDLNDLADPDRLSIGQILRLPQPPGDETSPPAETGAIADEADAETVPPLPPEPKIKPGLSQAISF